MTLGQIIEIDWECCSWKVIAESFHQLLDTYVTALENGRAAHHGRDLRIDLPQGHHYVQKHQNAVQFRTTGD